MTVLPATPRARSFAERLAFPLDRFQREALEVTDRGESVLVAAPTGSGKTVVADFVCHLAVTEGAKCFYTTPLKALSNQKYGDLVAAHGADRVGLLTGDNAINGEAPIVVMTTEVLRNMLYERSSTLTGLRWVVLDEVHYLQDRYRGAVWEEVLIHLPESVSVVCLSATVSNVEDFADWLRTLRGTTRAVVEHARPIELRSQVMVGHDIHPLLGSGGGPAKELKRVWEQGEQDIVRRRRKARRAGQRPTRTTYTPTRVEVVEQLARRDMLPAIVFIFSRAGCDEAADACVRSGMTLTTDAEAERIHALAEERMTGIGERDLKALRYGAFVEALSRGIASHHAGMLPMFKELVEELFAEGSVKVVFATETLSLGINMPARTVVIERLSKFTGERHELLTPTDYTQLTGRAGRRGIDDIGYGVTLFDPWVPLDKVAGLATRKAYALTSSFRPSYNMAVNLVRNHDRETAVHVLNSSFAQFVSDRTVVRWEREVERARAESEEHRAAGACSKGDIFAYHALREAAAEAEAAVRGAGAVSAALARLTPGQVVWARRGKALVLEQARQTSSGAPRVTVMTTDRKLRRVTPRDFRVPPEALATVAVRGQSWRSPKVRKTLAKRLGELDIVRPDAPAPRGRGGDPREAVTAHPCHSCPDVAEHLEHASRAVAAAERADQLTGKAERRRDTIARRFDRVLAVLDDLGYVEGWSVTEKGAMLTGVYNESDLLVVECLTRGLLADLDPAELISLASVFVYEARRREPDEPAPTPVLAKRERRVRELYRRLSAAEDRQRLELLKEPDSGFMARAYEWASGASLETVLEDRETSAGDFVRSMKQVIDLLQQVRPLAGSSLRAKVGAAIDLTQRGVVAHGPPVG